VGDDGGEAGPGTVEVPDVTGVSLEEANELLEAVGLRVGEVTFEVNEEVEPNIVFAMDPSRGAIIEEGETVDLTVSAADDIKNMPSLVGLTRDAAVQQLEQLGFTNIVFDEQLFNVDAEEVVDQDPAAGQEHPVAEPVTLSVSLGYEPRPVPDVAGRTQEEALEILTEAGFINVSVAPEPSSTVDVDRVTRTSPPADEVVDPSEPLTVFYSTGQPVNTVPNVQGLLADSAIQAINNAGFSPNPVFEPLPAGDPNIGVVISQTPGPDTTLALGSQVTLVIGSPDAPSTSDPPTTGPPSTDPPSTDPPATQPPGTQPPGTEPPGDG
ncbi:MAG: PASTA domain-containing protein, partial [Acidimicrobiia bacterium]|nr:PASTA domain-containing protein [Acidimicrobiia bacterium]